MSKDDLKNLLADAKQELEQDKKNFEHTIKEDLKSFKKKTLDKV